MNRFDALGRSPDPHGATHPSASPVTTMKWLKMAKVF
jgi:hypothetical protein